MLLQVMSRDSFQAEKKSWPGDQAEYSNIVSIVIHEEVEKSNLEKQMESESRKASHVMLRLWTLPLVHWTSSQGFEQGWHNYSWLQSVTDVGKSRRGMPVRHGWLSFRQQKMVIKIGQWP